MSAITTLMTGVELKGGGSCMAHRRACIDDGDTDCVVVFLIESVGAG